MVLALFLSGCTQTSFCGDQICSSGEENTCPTDCVAPVEAKVNVNVSGAYDAEGDISLYWYSSKDIQANAYSNITSRLGENWFGSESKNLYISFNDSKSGEVPVPSNRQVSMNFTKAGDYYFEVRSDDYEYRAVSEKITITESGEYYVNITLTPSNPALRVKVLDEFGSTLSGKGKITLTAIETICEYGECKDNEWEYDSRMFYDGEEMNGLFFLYVPYEYNFEKNVNMHYKIEVEKEGYLTQTGYQYPYGKYSEYQMVLGKDVPTQKGALKISIVPGMGTTKDDLVELEGKLVNVCDGYGECTESTILNKTIYLENLPYGAYNVYSLGYDYNSQSSYPPMSIAELKVELDSEIVYGETKGLRGIGIKLSILDGQGNFIDTVNDELYVLKVCTIDGDMVSCSAIQDRQRLTLQSNPANYSQKVYSEQQIIDSENQSISMELMYIGEKKWFSYGMKQGYTEYVWQFDGLDYNMN